MSKVSELFVNGLVSRDRSTQCYNCVMIPEFEPDGNLPPGIHWATWDEIWQRFAVTPWRQQLLSGFRSAVENLMLAGCRTVYLGGSIASAKLVPGDFDACWETTGVDVRMLDSVLCDFSGRRSAQKTKYGGEFFPASALANPEGDAFLEFFQTNKYTGARKGIVALDLGGLRDQE